MAQIAPRDVGYDTPANFSQLPRITFRETAGADSDTLRLQRAIRRASRMRTTLPGGGRVAGARLFLANGTYRIHNIMLESNVHLRFGPDVLLLEDQTTIPGLRGRDMFMLREGIRNGSFVGNSETDRVRIRAATRSSDPLERNSFRAFGIRDVNNFLIRNVFVDNQFSRFSTMILVAEGDNVSEVVDGPVPTRGTISNFTATNNPGGFGGIQMHAGSRIAYDNIRTVGGVALRLETGIATVSGIQDVTVTDVTSVRGRCAVLFQPHSVRAHNRIRLRDITSIGSATALQVLNGFVSSRDMALNRPEFTRPGIFRNVSVRGVTANFGSGEDAQVRPFQFRLVPESALPLIPPNLTSFIDGLPSNGDTLPTTPLAAVFDSALDYNVGIVRSTVRSVGFPAGLRQRFLNEDTPDRNDQERELRRDYRAFENAADAMR